MKVKNPTEAIISVSAEISPGKGKKAVEHDYAIPPGETHELPSEVVRLLEQNDPKLAAQLEITD